jgi:hypothetical protein
VRGEKLSLVSGLRRPAALSALAGVLALLCAAGASAGGDITWLPVHEQQARGNVSATLDYEKDASPDYTEYRNMRLRVSRAGTQVFDKMICSGPGCWPGGYQQKRAYALTLRNVSGNAEPEVIVEIYSGGAHCCRSTVIVSRGPGGYRAYKHGWADVGYRGQWRQGVYYFLSADPSFAYAFTSFAASGYPAQAWTLSLAGRLRDVTRNRLDYVRGNATRLWQWYQRTARDGSGSVRGFLAAWCADQYLLDQGAKCEDELERASDMGWLQSSYDDTSVSSYITKLRRFLRERGYARQ